MSPQATPNPEAGQETGKDSPKPAQKERRAFRRRPFRARVRIQTDALGMGPMVEVVGLNISEAGICFTTPKEVKVGKLVTVEISRQSTGKQAKWEAELRAVPAGAPHDADPTLVGVAVTLPAASQHRDVHPGQPGVHVVEQDRRSTHRWGIQLRHEQHGVRFE